jgi:hypothetical protein
MFLSNQINGGHGGLGPVRGICSLLVVIGTNRPQREAEVAVGSAHGKGVGMADKSPRKIVSKKSGKSLKEKRQDKKDKQQVRKGIAT